MFQKRLHRVSTSGENERHECLTAEKCNKYHDEDDGDQGALGDLKVPTAAARRSGVIVGTAIGTCVRCPSCIIAPTGVRVASCEREGRRRCRSHGCEEHRQKPQATRFEIPSQTEKTLQAGARQPCEQRGMWRGDLKRLQSKESGERVGYEYTPILFHRARSRSI